MYTSLKRTVLKFVPSPLLQALKKRHYARVLRTFTLDREPDLQIVRHLVEPGDRVIDLGANIGIYAKALADLVGPEGRVYSVEPVPTTFDLLRANLRSLGLDQVECLNCAISDSEGVVAMEIPQYETGGDNFYRARIAEPDGSTKATCRIPAQTIDRTFADGERPIAFVKCDVEGHELACIRGADRFLDRDRPAWLIEISGDPDAAGSTGQQVVAILAQKDYTAWWYDGHRLRPRRPGDQSVNYFFLQPAQVDLIRAKAPALVLER